MNQLHFSIAQGSTPRIKLLLPFDLTSGSVAFATFAQGNKAVLEYGFNGTPTAAIAATGTLALNLDDTSVLVLNMTQDDSLSLQAGEAELQIRVKTTAGAYTFFPIPGVVIRAIKTEVIS